MNSRTWDLATGFSLSLLFLSLLLAYGPFNIEQYHHSFPASLDFYSNLLSGQYIFWSGGFGFGTPLPLGENLNLHPLFLLAPYLPLRLLFSIFWLFHLTLGAFYFLRLCRRLAVVEPIRICLLFSYVFSVATVNYSYLNDWPSIFLGWTFFPVLVFYLDKFVASGVRGAPRFGVARLALLFGICVLNTHLGYLIILCVVLLVFVLVRSRLRPRTIGWLCFAGFGILCLTAERAYFIISELRRFPEGLERKAQAPYTVEDWLRQLSGPVNDEIAAAALDLDEERLITAYLDRHKGLRIPFMGLIAFLAASSTAFFALWPRRRRASPGLLRACAACFLFSFTCSLIPPSYLLKIPSGMWLFRDPTLFFGLLLAGKGLTLWQAARPGKETWVKTFLALQCIQLTLAVMPGILAVYRKRDVNTQFYRGRHEESFARWLNERTGTLGSRIYLSPRVADNLLSEKAVYASLGLLGTGDFHRLGLEPVNGYFKGVSLVPLSPPLHLMMSIIRADLAVIRSHSTFDVLGIDFLLIERSESLEIDSKDLSHLEPLGSYSVPDLKEPLILMHNPDAWPRAVLFPIEVTELSLELLDCEGPTLLQCSDLSALKRLRLQKTPRLQGADESLTITMVPSDRDRIAMVSMMYRPEWRAFDENGHELGTLPIAKAMLGIEIPAGIDKVALRFDPRWRRRLLALQLAAAFVCLAQLKRRPWCTRDGKDAHT